MDIPEAVEAVTGVNAAYLPVCAPLPALCHKATHWHVAVASQASMATLPCKPLSLTHSRTVWYLQIWMHYNIASPQIRNLSPVFMLTA